MALFSNVPENNNSMSFPVQLEVNDAPIFIVSNSTCISFGIRKHRLRWNNWFHPKNVEILYLPITQAEIQHRPS